jgi:hypothetical protein
MDRSDSYYDRGNDRGYSSRSRPTDDRDRRLTEDRDRRAVEDRDRRPVESRDKRLVDDRRDYRGDRERDYNPQPEVFQRGEKRSRSPRNTSRYTREDKGHQNDRYAGEGTQTKGMA